MQFSEAFGRPRRASAICWLQAPWAGRTRAHCSHTSSVSRASALIARPEQRVAPADVQAFAQLVQRCQRGEPLAYLLGEKEFYGRVFDVSPAVLIPRPETELLVEVALSAGISDGAQVLDLGTGSGCVAITLALERPSWQVIATDVSRDALEVARPNAAKLASANVAFRRGHWFRRCPDQRFDLIVSNPPYVAAGDSHLQALRFEPQMALVAARKRPGVPAADHRRRAAGICCRAAFWCSNTATSRARRSARCSSAGGWYECTNAGRLRRTRPGHAGAPRLTPRRRSLHSENPT